MAQGSTEVSMRDIMRAIIIGSLVFSAVFCHGVAKMRQKSPAFWGVMGLIFGPLAIAYLFIHQDVSSKSIESLKQRVEYFLELGLLDNRHNQGSEYLAHNISQKYQAEWGELLDIQDPSADLLLLQYGSRKVWWKDTEADVIESNNVYVSTLNEWGKISEGAFTPTEVTENWETNQDRIQLTFKVNGKQNTIMATICEDYLDMNVLKQINKLIPSTGSAYEMVKPFDQTAFVIWLSKRAKASLIKRGWEFVW